MSESDQPFGVPDLDVDTIEKVYPALWATVARDFPGLPVEARARVVALVVGTCGACHDAPRSCQCWNDE